MAVDTGESKVVGVVVAVMLLRDDVLDLKRGKWRLLLMQATVFAPIPRAFRGPVVEPQHPLWLGSSEQLASLRQENGINLLAHT